MATTVTTSPLTKSGFGSDLKSSANRYRIGMWVACASILMMFTALSSAYIVRAASSTDWTPLQMPRILLVSSGLILLSSITMEAARRKWQDATQRPGVLLLATIVFGLGFLVCQIFAWRQLARQGIFVASNPHSSFFYVFTATHGIHLLGGLLALSYLTLRRRSVPNNQGALARSKARADAVALYWHFMDFLWIYLFVLLFFVR
ncbi:MAG TPA: cytochrome c oxidase subunit 3 [Pyrinomonadaceae bacterium]|nr:cytochrome c oxidase subunit 3 [Pyrinomonadaceae bacterium]